MKTGFLDFILWILLGCLCFACCQFIVIFFSNICTVAFFVVVGLAVFNCSGSQDFDGQSAFSGYLSHDYYILCLYYVSHLSSRANKLSFSSSYKSEITHSSSNLEFSASFATLRGDYEHFK